MVSHPDLIEALVADALGLHLDGFGRIVVEPWSLTVIRHDELRAFLVRCNDTGGSVDALVPRPKSGRRRVAKGRPSGATDSPGSGPAVEPGVAPAPGRRSR